ncbi:hypothetical protein PENSPDRAFT_737634 [Peniophora sp. CONT]|nr:hypothetical protein PENSPDRAFT_737634 [Peniophora sp. CONT]
MGDLVIISIAFTLEIHQGRIPSIVTQRCMLYAIPAFFLAISCATGAGMVWTSPGADVMSNMPVKPSSRGFAVAWMSFNLVTNLVYTAVFVYEFLLRRKQHNEGNLSVYGGSFNAFLFTFIFCGLLYCFTFLILLALYLTDRRIYWVANHMIPQLTGIYPITTIAVVAVKKNNAPSTLPYSFNRPRSRSDLIIRTPREIKCSLVSSTPSNFHDTESARAALPLSTTPSTLQIAYPPPTAFSLSRKLLPLPRPWRKGVAMRRSAVVPAIKLYIEVERTVEREPEAEDALPKALCWSPMPHHLPWSTAGASSNTQSRTLVDGSKLLEPLKKYALSEVEGCESCDDTLPVPAKQGRLSASSTKEGQQPEPAGVDEKDRYALKSVTIPAFPQDP